MSTTAATPKLVAAAAGEPALFDSLARLVPKELQAGYCRVLAHARTLSPDDEMLRILKGTAGASSMLRTVADSRHGVMAQVEEASHRFTFSLESRAKAIDELLRELKSDFLHIWVPLLCGASLLMGLFLGMSIQGWRDSPPATAPSPTPAAVQSTQVPAPNVNEQPAGITKKPRHSPSNTASPAEHER